MWTLSVGDCPLLDSPRLVVDDDVGDCAKLSRPPRVVGSDDRDETDDADNFSDELSKKRWAEN